MTNSFVLPYVNPDTDGVCSAIALAFFLKKSRGETAIPIYWGKLDKETEYVLQQSRAEIYPAPNEFEPNSKFYIVDTHQGNQLPANLPFASVVEIIDHHPTGNPDLFPNAQIINEVIGAAATIIAEKFQDNNIVPDSVIATLLISAIISNTLDLKAPTTAQRDIDAVKWLKTLIAMDADYVEKMLSARSSIGEISTSDILKKDYKEFDFSGFKVGISQLETIAMDDFLKRSDILSDIEKIFKEKQLDHFILNCADIRMQRGALMAFPKLTQGIVEKIVPDAIFDDNIAYTERILLRKSDLIPQLKEYFSTVVS